MAMTICTVPVLTGEVANSFEKRAREAEKMASERKLSSIQRSAYNKNIKMVESILAKAKF